MSKFKIVSTNPPLTEAVELLVSELRKDEDYYDTWQSNIAMAFYDEYFNSIAPNDFVPNIDKQIGDIANDAAKRFLHTLMMPSPKVKVWQYSTKQDPDIWKDATDEEYERGRDLMRYNWRRITK